MSNWFFMDLDGGSPYTVLIDPLVSHGMRGPLFSQFTSFVDNSVYQSKKLLAPGSLALREAFNCIFKFAGALIFWSSSGSNYCGRRNLSKNSHGLKPVSGKSCSRLEGSCRRSCPVIGLSSSSNGKFSSSVTFGRVVNSMFRRLFKEAEQLQSLPVLSLAAALVTPFNNLSPIVLSVPVDRTDVQMSGCMGQLPCEVRDQECAGLFFPELYWKSHAIEPRTGIEFPTVLENTFSGVHNTNLIPEVLVGTGSKTVTIVKIKSLNIYAFGFYIHPYSVCEKLGPKYASGPMDELDKHHEFYKDILREDINMTVRFVINYNGIKINTVKDAFEKSLRARLLKANPDTDFHCLRMFGSYFMQDIPLPVGTVIDFRQTSDGQLITEIGGNQIGAVHSKDLCRAFFDMYLGDGPVSEQTKEDIGRNVASIIQRC